MPSGRSGLQFGKNLPRVAEYARNVGKSISYSTVDYFKGTMSETSSFIENNQDLFKDIYSAARDYKNTIKAVDRSIKQSKIYEAGTELKKTLFDSIRTGKFYDDKRQQEYSLKASGDMGDFSTDDDFGSFDQFDIDMEDEDFNESDAGKSSSIISAAVQDATHAQAGVIAKSTEYLAETNKESTRLLFAQGEKLYASMNSGMANVQSMLNRANGFLEGPLTTHMENSTKFYREITEKMNAVSGMMKELVEMQRNLYKREQAKIKESQYSRVGGGTPDLREYGKEVYKNFKEILGPEIQMVLGDDMGENSNMLLAMVANPLKFIPDYLVKTLVPVTIKNSLEALDKSFSGLFANFIGRMNNAAKGGDNLLLETLGKLFGLKMDTKSSFDPGKYEKGPVPFDGVTKKAIVDVIPGHLARIEAALTSKSERVFDYESGRWMTIEEVERDYKRRKKRAYMDGAYNHLDTANEYISELSRHDPKAAAEFRAEVEKVIKKIYQDNGIFEPYRAHGSGDDKVDPNEYYGVDKVSDFLLIADMLVGKAGNKRKNAMQLAADMQESMEDYARWLRRGENQGTSMVRHLANNAYKFDMMSDEITKDSAGKQIRGVNFSNVIAEATDKYNKNIFYYLRGIYAELIASRTARATGGRYTYTGSGRRYTTGYTPTPSGVPIDPLADLERRFNDELDQAAAAEYIRSQRNQNAEDNFNETVFSTEWRDLQELKRKEDEKNKKAGTGLFARLLGDDDKTDSDKGLLESLLGASSLGEKFKVIVNNINKLTAKPGLAIAGVIDTADKRLFQLVFGSDESGEIVDKEGRSVKGLLEYMVFKVEDSFNKFNDWLDENILEPLKNKLGVESIGDYFKKLGDRLGINDKVRDIRERYVNPVLSRVRDKLGWFGNEFKGSMSRTYGAGYRHLVDMLPDRPIPAATTDQGDNLADTDYIEQLIAAGILSPNDVAGMARGGLITRRGIAIVSPGERIIPAGGPNTQKANLSAERAFAKRYGIKNARFYATGTGANTVADEEAARDTVRQVVNEVMGDTKHKGIANVIASGLIGGGVSLLTGLVGGPLLGAAVGSAFGIVQNSNSVQEWLFGKEFTDQNTGETYRTGGVISKDLQDKFKKYFPSIKDFGLAGAVAGLFTPLGLVGGLMAGSAIGFIKETDSFKDYIFGKADENGEREGGLINKEFREKVKKAAPSMAVGLVGGALLGPFGLLGNAVLGSALGYVTTTDSFRNFILGTPDDDGKRKGGVVGALYDGLLKPAILSGKKFVEDFAEFTREKIFKPFDNFIKPFGQLIKNTITEVGDFFKDKLREIAEDSIGAPIRDFLEHSIFRGVATWTKRLLFLPATAAKGLVSAPFALLGGIGNNIRMGQIRRGTATDMTAAQRNEFRRKHGIRRLLISRQDVFSRLDRDLAGMEGEQGINDMVRLRDELKIYLNTKDELGKQVADLVNQAGEILSNYLNNTYSEDDPTKTLYQMNKYGKVKAIHKDISEGNRDKVVRDIFKLNISTDQANELIAQLDPIMTKIQEAITNKRNARTYQRELQSRLSFKTGGALHNTRNIRQYYRMLGTEIDARRAEQARLRAENPEEAAAKTVSDTINKRAQEMILILKGINFGIRVLSGRDQWGSENDPFVQEEIRRREEEAASQGQSFDPDSIDTDDIDREGLDDISSRGPGILSRFRNFRSGIRQRRRTIRGKIAEKVKGAVRGAGDLLMGSTTDIRNAFRAGYHMVTTPAGESAPVDERGRVLPGSRSASSVREYLKQSYAEHREQFGVLKSIAGTATNLAGAVFGGVTKTVGGALTWAKEGIGGILEGVLNNTGIVGKIFGALPKLGLLAVGVAAAGHFSELWIKTIWPDYVQPVVSKIWTGIVDFGTNIATTLKDLFPSVFDPEQGPNLGSFVKGIKDGFTSFIEDPTAFIGKFFEKFTSWFTEGWSLFKKNIFDPLWNQVIEPGIRTLLPYVSQAIYDAIHGTDRDGLLAATYGKSTDTIESQAISTSGKKMWIDNSTGEVYEADVARNSADQAYTTRVTVQSTGYKDDLLSQIRNTVAANGADVDIKREAYDEMYDRNFILLISSEKNTQGQVTIKCKETGEYITLKNGDESTYLTYGYASDKRGQAVITGAGVGGLVGFVAVSAVLTFVTGGLYLAGLGAVAACAAVGGVAGGYVYEMAGGGYYACRDFSIESAEAVLLLRSFGLENGLDNWPTFPQDVKYANMSSEEKMEYDKNKSSSAKISDMIAKETGYDFGTTGIPTTPIYVWNPSTHALMHIVPGNGSEVPYTRWPWMRAYYTYDEKVAYYDTRTNALSLPPEILEMIDKDKWVMNTDSSNTSKYPPYGVEGKDPLVDPPQSESKTKASRTTGNLKKNTTSSKITTSLNKTSLVTSSAKSRHLYQNDASIAHKRFGNSTVGDAGCAPVAMVNLMNRLRGRSRDLDIAINAATGYQDYTGGTSMNYFTDYLAANGYSSASTSSKGQLLGSIASGNPAILLGNSGKETGTPFGANNHYINALGVDRSGNMIVEDPDLPQSTKKYPVKDVMRDTISGVMTGGYLGRARKNARLKRGLRRFTGRDRANEVEIYTLATRVFPILYSGESSGNYGAINANDNGAVSVGMIQWHGAKAHDILLATVTTLGETESRNILGDSLYNKIVNNDRSVWESVTFTANSSDVKKLSTLLSTEAGQKVQNAKALKDISDYIQVAINKGLKDENAIAYTCHLQNAHGYLPQRYIDGAKKLAGSVGAINLDHIYTACLNDTYDNNKYYRLYGENGYAAKIYNAIKNTETVGLGKETIDVSNLNLDIQSDLNTVNQAVSYDTSTDDESLISLISKAGYETFKAIYGEPLAKLLGIDLSSSGDEASSTFTGTNVARVDANAPTSTKQKALANAMASIKGQIKYSLEGAQDPDKGSASCASTVSWAYRKVLGVNPGGSSHASSTAQATDSRFSDIYVNTGDGNVDTSMLRPGDIMYYAWNKTTNAAQNGYKEGYMDHTEMYKGDNQDWSHGGNPTYGPVKKDLDSYRRKHLMKVRRYNDFIYNTNGSTASDDKRLAMSEKKIAGMSRRRNDLRTYGRARSGYTINTSAVNRANQVIKSYGLDPSVTTVTTTGDSYAHYFAAMVTLLSVIADNSEALKSLQQLLANKGTTISTDQLEKAAGNARKRVKNSNGFSGIFGSGSNKIVDLGDSSDMEAILNSPTGTIFQIMESLAKE